VLVVVGDKDVFDKLLWGGVPPLGLGVVRLDPPHPFGVPLSGGQWSTALFEHPEIIWPWKIHFFPWSF